MISPNYFINMRKLCQSCGDAEHQTRDCPIILVPCHAVHNPVVRHPPHSVLMCPRLHAYCKTCKIRGHMEGEHDSPMEKSPLELRKDFKRFCHLGMLTSIPFLYDNRQLSSNHWKASLSGTAMNRGQADVWMYAGLAHTFGPDQLKDREADRERARRNLTSTPATMERPSLTLNFPEDE